MEDLIMVRVTRMVLMFPDMLNVDDVSVKYRLNNQTTDDSLYAQFPVILRELRI